MSDNNKEVLGLFKATVTVKGHLEEVPVWAEDLDKALEQAEAEYGEVERVRPVVTP
ncbi:host cell RNA polymerase inhibitor [Pseudomonas aeruginosa]|uniref:host cell RNA polymerase inhibitor n=1 Tax=Pseudomonas aeruginosa TaxID=287 RepID=UPI003F83D0BD|nr:host cell RNA polymerase inhibitor [Pseudomonas aeruginosa]